jgi:uncharacterized protein YaeQ
MNNLFNNKLYKILNPDLSHMNEEQLINHYIEHGNKENRLINIDCKLYKILHLWTFKTPILNVLKLL